LPFLILERKKKTVRSVGRFKFTPVYISTNYTGFRKQPLSLNEKSCFENARAVGDNGIALTRCRLNKTFSCADFENS